MSSDALFERFLSEKRIAAALESIAASARKAESDPGSPVNRLKERVGDIYGELCALRDNTSKWMINRDERYAEDHPHKPEPVKLPEDRWAVVNSIGEVEPYSHTKVREQAEYMAKNWNVQHMPLRVVRVRFEEVPAPEEKSREGRRCAAESASRLRCLGSEGHKEDHVF